MRILDTVNSPADLKKLSISELNTLCSEIRQMIIDTVTHNGGHLASALGAVELTVALHYIFDAPNDKIIFDVGHQSYCHKIITGRKDTFKTLRKLGGEHAFTRSSASIYDTFISGHSSTSLSVACGLMRARALSDDDYNIISVIGDGALSGGMTHEALNDAGSINGKQIIIINDNSMSISKSVGSVADLLAKMHTRKWYNRIKNYTLRKFSRKKTLSRSYSFLRTFRNSVKYFLQGGLPFDNYGLKYFGPMDGHNIEELIRYLNIAKNESRSVVIHAVTVKGNGYLFAEQNPKKYHGLSPDDEVSPDLTFSKQAGASLVELARMDNRVIAVTGAMASGTGLSNFSREFPDRFYDVGIAESHAVTMCGALASVGYKPYFAVYSTFLQRGFDQIIHDISIERQNVTFLIDRSGIVGPDGETHQGIFDISYLNIIPNITIASPIDTRELDMLIKWSLDYKYPLAIRYPRGGITYDMAIPPIDDFSWWYVKRGSGDKVIIAAGADMLSNSLNASESTDYSVISARFIKPLDEKTLISIKDMKIFVVEDNVLNGGLYSAITVFYSKSSLSVNITPIAIDNCFVAQGTKEQLFNKHNLSSKSIKRITNAT